MQYLQRFRRYVGIFVSLLILCLVLLKSQNQQVYLMAELSEDKVDESQTEILDESSDDLSLNIATGSAISVTAVTGSAFSVQIPKRISFQDETSSSFTISVKGTLPEGSVLHIQSPSTFLLEEDSLSDLKKPAILGTIYLSKEDWTASELSDTYQVETTNHIQFSNCSAGTFKGTFSLYFSVELPVSEEESDTVDDSIDESTDETIVDISNE